MPTGGLCEGDGQCGSTMDTLNNCGDNDLDIYRSRVQCLPGTMPLSPTDPSTPEAESPLKPTHEPTLMPTYEPVIRLTPIPTVVTDEPVGTPCGPITCPIDMPCIYIPIPFPYYACLSDYQG